MDAGDVHLEEEGEVGEEFGEEKVRFDERKLEGRGAGGGDAALIVGVYDAFRGVGRHL